MVDQRSQSHALQTSDRVQDLPEHEMQQISGGGILVGNPGTSKRAVFRLGSIEQQPLYDGWAIDS